MNRDPHDVTPVQLRELLAHWHGWRCGWSHERGYARVSMWASDGPDDELEQLQLDAFERVFNSLPADERTVIAHMARQEFLGVQVFRPTRPMDVQKALEALQRGLQLEGVF